MNRKIRSALTKVTLFYSAISVILYIGIQIEPDVFRLLPTGSTEQLYANGGMLEINATTIPSRIRTNDYEKQGFFLLTSFLSALLLSIPVGTTELCLAESKLGVQINSIIIT